MPFDREIKVSIHTPTQGVTGNIVNGNGIVIVSIHTPTQGVTHLKYAYGLMLSFNPHTHAGCDYIVIIKQQVIIVSIHTPTQGVTSKTEIKK